MNEYDVDIAFHNHTQIATDTYDGALLDYSDRFKINFDIGNYVAANNDDPLAFIRRYRDRLASIHIKDRRSNNGPELPFGTGDTPLVELFAMLKAERIDVPCDIEVEYDFPSGSDAVRETRKCREFCRNVIIG
jgi:sugar phosphate isomerase/epimerase